MQNYTIVDPGITKPFTVTMHQPAQPVALGAWTPPFAPDWNQQYPPYYKTRVGVNPRFTHFYQDLRDYTVAPWNQWNPSGLCHAAAAAASLPIVSWELCDSTVSPEQNQPNYACTTFTAGDHDAVMTPWLQAAGAWGKPFILRYFWEMTGQWYPWAVLNGCNGNTPGTFIDAWRHVYTLVKQYAPNAHVVWCPSVIITGVDGGLVNMADVYPGDAYVDILGLDGYNTGTVADGWDKQWLTFSQVFQPSYNQLMTISPSKYVLVVETGCVSTGGNKPQWIAQIPAALQSMPQMRGICWWNSVTGNNNDLDFHFDDGGTALAAYKKLAAESVMQGTFPLV